MPGDFGEVGLLGGVAVFASKEHILFALLGSWLNQAAIGAFVVRNMAVSQHKAGGLHHLTANFLERSRAEVRHVYSIFQQQLRPQFFKAGKEHPSVLGNHRLIPVLAGHLPATLNEHSKQIALAVWIALLYKLIEPCVHVAAAHIRRIRCHHIVLLRQYLRYADQRQNGVQGRFPIELMSSCTSSARAVQGSKSTGATVRMEPYSFASRRSLHDAVQRRFQIRIVVHKVVQ